MKSFIEYYLFIHSESSPEPFINFLTGIDSSKFPREYTEVVVQLSKVLSRMMTHLSSVKSEEYLKGFGHVYCIPFTNSILTYLTKQLSNPESKLSLFLAQKP